MTERGKCIARTAAIAATAFTIFFLIFELIFLFPERETEAVRKHLLASTYGRLAATLVLSAASIVLSIVFVWAALRSSWVYRLIYVAAFFLLTAIEYAAHAAFGMFSNFSLAVTAVFAGDKSFITNSAKEYFSWLSLAPVTAFILLLFVVKPSPGKGLRLLCGVVISAIFFYSASAFFTRNQYYTISLSAGTRTLIELPTRWYAGSIRGPSEHREYRAPRRQVDFRSESRPANNIVLIIDESVRGDHLSLNGYGVPTTDFLVELAERGLLKNWGIAVSGATCSMAANNMLLTGVRAETDAGAFIFRLPTIFQFARSMNYRTYHFNGQTSEQWLGKPEDSNYIDHFISSHDLGFPATEKLDIDSEIARRVSRIASQSTGNFIWISKVGVHKPYTSAFPNEGGAASRDIWGTPYDPSVDKKDLIDAYDKAITYNAHSFFVNLIGGADLNASTIYIYTSDHGQSLQENGSMVSHCSDTKPEANVPLFIIAHPQIIATAETSYKASHANIFPTILDLMGVPYEARGYTYALSLMKASALDSNRRFFVAGNAGVEGPIIPFD